MTIVLLVDMMKTPIGMKHAISFYCVAHTTTPLFDEIKPRTRRLISHHILHALVEITIQWVTAICSAICRIKLKIPSSRMNCRIISCRKLDLANEFLRGNVIFFFLSLFLTPIFLSKCSPWISQLCHLKVSDFDKQAKIVCSRSIFEAIFFRAVIDRMSSQNALQLCLLLSIVRTNSEETHIILDFKLHIW